MPVLPKAGLQRATLKKISAIVGLKNLSVRDIDRITASRDAWIRNLIRLQNNELPTLPDAVVWPATPEEVSSLVRLATLEKFSLIPLGAGSGVCGGIEGGAGRVVVDLKKMNRILEVDRETFSVRAQTGILGQHLENALNQQGLTLGHFPSSILCSTLGGWVAARSAGQFSSKYGKIEDMLLGGQWVLPSGDIVWIIDRPGDDKVPNWSALMVGSEGTLGFITEARLRVRPLPAQWLYRGLEFKTVESALTAVRRIMQAGLFPTVVRLYDPLDSLIFRHGYQKGDVPDDPGEMMQLIGKLVHQTASRAGRALISHPELLETLIRPLPGGCMLILGFEGDEKVATAKLNHALRLCDLASYVDQGSEPGRYWEAHRYGISFKLAGLLRDGYFVDTMEVAGRWSDLAELYERVRGVLSKKVLVLAHFSHAYPEGCSIYFTFVGFRKDPAESLKVYHEVWNEGLAAVREAGGTISHHHGIGRLKVEALQAEMGPGYAMLQRFKKALDPHHIMNPGNLGL